MKKNKDFDYRKAAADLDGAGAHDPDEIYEYRSEKAIRSYMSEHFSENSLTISQP